ncbi:hypothetical protein AB0G02_05755 [Actinosynnema sp. NPDC023658]|uniref:hypothetical protein n=1 Tax=Actinosynnema sp. NPDC023658 TaxID=3155465 RepID=UPI0033E7945D
MGADGLKVTTTRLVAGDSTLGATLCTTVTYDNSPVGRAISAGGTDWKLQSPNGAIRSDRIAWVNAL